MNFCDIIDKKHNSNVDCIKIREVLFLGSQLQQFSEFYFGFCVAGLLVAAGVTAPDGCGRVCLMPSWGRGGPHGKATFSQQDNEMK